MAISSQGFVSDFWCHLNLNYPENFHLLSLITRTVVAALNSLTHVCAHICVRVRVRLCVLGMEVTVSLYFNAF